jgi:hypothetical protein
MPRLRFKGRRPNTASDPSLLPYSPPIITGATHHFLTPLQNTYSVGTGNHVIHLPDEPMTGGFVRINGVNVADDMTIIGGHVAPPKVYDSETLRLLSIPANSPAFWGEWYIRSRIGVTATGGNFTIRLADATGFQTTAPISYNSSTIDEDIKDAINDKLGAGACFAVENEVSPNHLGGPWTCVPGENALMGKLTITGTGNLTGFTAGGSNPFRATSFLARVNGFQPLQWKRHCHVEGLLVYSEDMNDALNVATRHATAILTLQNCHFRSGGRIWHNDWIHPDGAQMFLGPAKMYTHNCTFISIGTSVINQPRNQQDPQNLQPPGGPYPEGLQALFDYHWSNIDCHSYLTQPLLNDPAIGFAVFEQYGMAPIHSNGTGPDPYPTSWNDCGWLHHMNNCWVEIIDVDTGLPITSLAESNLEWYSHLRSYPLPNVNLIPVGMTIRAKPTEENGASANGYFCDPAVSGSCGVGYVTPGYTGNILPEVQQRLNGEFMVIPF